VPNGAPRPNAEAGPSQVPPRHSSVRSETGNPRDTPSPQPQSRDLPADSEAAVPEDPVIEIKEEPDVPPAGCSKQWCQQCKDGAYLGLNHQQLTFLLHEANDRAKVLAAENARLIAENEAKDRKIAESEWRLNQVLNSLPSRNGG
jgi:hypothetical protein